MVFLSLGGWSPKTLARRSSTCSGRLGGAAAAGRTMVMSPAAPDSFFSDIPVRGRKRRKVKATQQSPVLVVGQPRKKQKNNTAASIKARQWKSLAKKVGRATD